MRKVRREIESAVVDGETIRSMFDRYDKDANGKIELQEMMQVVQEIDESATPEQVTDLFRRADTDGDGVVDFDELAAVAGLVVDDSLDLRALLSRKRSAQGSFSRRRVLFTRV
jgi:hypothetical protein